MTVQSPTDVFFYIFATMGSLFALRVVTAKNPIAGALSLVLTFFCVASLYVLQQAHFIAAIQILVYAGAVMVLFIFVIMLLDADLKVSDFGRGFMPRAAAGALALGFFAVLTWALRKGAPAIMAGPFGPDRIEELGGNTRVVSELMFSEYILPFELTSILLLVGIVGSVALAKRAKRGRRP